MFYRVIDCLLNNEIEMRSHRFIEQTWRVNPKEQPNVDFIAHPRPRRERLQGGQQAAAFQGHRGNAQRQLSHALYCVIDQADDFIQFRIDRRGGETHAACQTAQHQRDPRQLLADAIVQIAPQTTPFVICDFDDFCLQLLALGDILHDDQNSSLPIQVYIRG